MNFKIYNAKNVDQKDSQQALKSSEQEISLDLFEFCKALGNVIYMYV